MAGSLYDHRTYSGLLHQAKRARSKIKKGASLEELVGYLLGTVPGLEVKARDVRGPAEEIDLVVWNESRGGVFSCWDPVLLIECKNWSSPVGSPEVVVFIDKLRRLGLRNGILVAREGVTGAATRDAQLLLREALRDRIQIIVVTLDELSRVTDVSDFLELCKGKYCRVFLSKLQ